MKKFFMVLALVLAAGVFAACDGDTAATSDLLQAQAPQDGDTVVTLHTNMGDIEIRLFPEEAPMAYVNFVTHAINGFYDGVIFHRVIPGFMIQGGDPEGTGMGGHSIWGEGFGPEYSPYLRHFRGALAMAQSSLPNSIGSQFYIVHNFMLDERAQVEMLMAIESQDEVLGTNHLGEEILIGDIVPAAVAEHYLAHGGTPHLDIAMNPAGHTVFGQVSAGMNVVDSIAVVETGANDRPVNVVVIESVSVVGTRLFEMSPDDLLAELQEGWQ